MKNEDRQDLVDLMFEAFDRGDDQDKNDVVTMCYYMNTRGPKAGRILSYTKDGR